MTRINCIPPKELCDQHLIAEYREMLRYNKTFRRWLGAKKPSAIPAHYKLGKGHVTFFNDKLVYLEKRHTQLRAEMKRRGFKVNYALVMPTAPPPYRNDWVPTEMAIKINRIRVIEQLKNMVVGGEMPRWTNTTPPNYWG